MHRCRRLLERGGTRRTGPRLHACGERSCCSRDRELASDATSEAFAQGIARGDAVRAPGAWVWKAAFVIARGELARRRMPSPDLGDVFSVDTAPEDVLDLIAALLVIASGAMLFPALRDQIVGHT